jgi:hypothetical protein
MEGKNCECKTDIRYAENPLAEVEQAMLDKVFTYHAPEGDQPARYVALRDRAREYAELVIRLAPASRERSLAMTKLEEVVFWANAAIARNE